jgi:hypothetical protein
VGQGVTTLVDFLSARIAEDEAAAERAAVLSTRNGFAWIGPTPDEAVVLAISGTRLLAECGTKRAIVESYRGLREIAKATGRAGRTEEAAVTRNMYAGVRMAMELLATAYSDHEDYRSEWPP